MKRCILHISFLFLASNLLCQNTVGVLHYESQEISKGYNLIYPNNQGSVFLLDNCGRILHEWEDSGRPGTMAELLPDGSLLRASFNSEIISSGFGSGGVGGIIDILSWENEILWRHIIADSVYRQHHQVHMMPNGNVLALVYERQSFESIVAAGFDTLSYTQDELWSDMVLEIDPETDSIVWQWSAWDHLIQDFDPTKENFGNIEESNGSIDINYQTFTNGRPDFIHLNSVDYNPELDQILISARNYSEIWILDHSTTTEEAATDTGGMYNKGGQIIYRWGNPDTYRIVGIGAQKLFNQHDAKWIVGNTIPELNGRISLFNNNVLGGELSLAHIIDPVWSVSDMSYQLDDEAEYLPKDYSLEFSHPDTSKNLSGVGSSFQVLKDGNVIMHAATQGRSFELDQSGNLIWEYKLPIRFGERITQGTELQAGQNFLFQMKRYGLDYPAFLDKDLTPGDYLELNPNLDFCDAPSSIIEEDYKKQIAVFPNPSLENIITIQNNTSEQLDFVLVTILGRQLTQGGIRGEGTIFLDRLDPGVYLIHFPELGFSRKLIVQ